MSNGEELYAYIKKLADFIRSTNSISALLMRLHLEEVQTGDPTSEEFVLKEYDCFKNLIAQAKEDGISDDSIFSNQVKVINGVFAYFSDMIPELKELP